MCLRPVFRACAPPPSLRSFSLSAPCTAAARLCALLPARGGLLAGITSPCGLRSSPQYASPPPMRSAWAYSLRSRCSGLCGFYRLYGGRCSALLLGRRHHAPTAPSWTGRSVRAPNSLRSRGSFGRDSLLCSGVAARLNAGARCAPVGRMRCRPHGSRCAPVSPPSDTLKKFPI